MITAGVDMGAITAKAAICGAGGLLATAVVQAGYDRAAAALQVLDQALAKAGLAREQVACLVATGYGRVQVPGADRTVTEITCHARGAHHLCPGVRTVIDIGGQDSKAIAVGPDGRVLDFVMNDKWAAGSGRFLGGMGRGLEVGVGEVGGVAVAGRRGGPISSSCTGFGGSEVNSHMAEGVVRDEIAAGIHEAIAVRIATMAGRIAVQDVVVLTGGVARNAGVARMLEGTLGHAIVVPGQAQMAGAIGAEIIA